MAKPKDKHKIAGGNERKGNSSIEDVFLLTDKYALEAKIDKIRQVS